MTEIPFNMNASIIIIEGEGGLDGPKLGRGGPDLRTT